MEGYYIKYSINFDKYNIIILTCVLQCSTIILEGVDTYDNFC